MSETPTTATANPAAQESGAPTKAQVENYVMDEQMRHVWNTMLRQATQAGATRKDIVVFTLEVADKIVGTSIDALWPVANVPDTERALFNHLNVALSDLSDSLATLT